VELDHTNQVEGDGNKYVEITREMVSVRAESGSKLVNVRAEETIQFGIV
jgi:hypothetical protein